jgi:hypothetical protein
MPVLDPRNADEVIGYDENRLPLAVIDTSAIVAIVLNEPEAEAFETAHRRCADSPDLGRDPMASSANTFESILVNRPLTIGDSAV